MLPWLHTDEGGCHGYCYPGYMYMKVVTMVTVTLISGYMQTEVKVAELGDTRLNM